MCANAVGNLEIIGSFLGLCLLGGSITMLGLGTWSDDAACFKARVQSPADASRECCQNKSASRRSILCKPRAAQMKHKAYAKAIGAILSRRPRRCNISSQSLARIPSLLAQALRTSYYVSKSTETISATSYSNAMRCQTSLAAPVLSTTSRQVFRGLLAKLLATFCAALEFNTDSNLA